ncbi:MAG: lipopolysaccharide transport periplasmic protein LptA [Sphingomonadales bacterium]|nr:lipopolysaccharide transport periplasmic protein LptA [Sphingomonadales bacterium]
MSKRVLTLAFSLLLLPHAALAEKADREKPIQVEAQKMTVDDARKIQILEGSVVLTKGTMVIQADRVVITEDQYGFQKGTAFGGPGGLARFRQKRDAKDEFIEGEAERIEYNTRNEVAELFHRAWVKSGDDQVKGNYIWYDSIGEKFLATAGDSTDPKGPPSRVRAILQPKNKGSAAESQPAAKSDRLKLQGAEGLTTPPTSPGPIGDNKQ